MVEPIIQYIHSKRHNNELKNDNLWNKGESFKMQTLEGDVFCVHEYGAYVNKNKEYTGGTISNDDLYPSVDGACLTEGHRCKNYFLIETKALNELIKEKQENPDCSYVTSIDELLVSGHVPNQIPGLVMDQYDDKLFRNKENFVSKLLNYYGVPTVYNQTVIEEIDFFGKKREKPLTISIDFVKPNEKFYTFDEYVKDFPLGGFRYFGAFAYKIEKFLYVFESVFREHYKRVKENAPELALSDEEIDAEVLKNAEALCYAKLCRNYGLGDADFTLHNSGVIVNEKTKQISLAPSFDLEAADNYSMLYSCRFVRWFKGFKESENPRRELMDFYETCTNDPISTNTIGNILYIQENFPTVIQKFLEKTNALLKSENGENCLLDEFFDELFLKTGMSEDEKINAKQSYVDGITLIKDICEIVASENSMCDCIPESI